jgi:transposase
VAVLIERKLGIRYHPGHFSKLLKSWGWSPQKPERKASQRDEAAIEQWITERWPAIKKEGRAGGAYAALRR